MKIRGYIEEVQVVQVQEKPVSFVADTTQVKVRVRYGPTQNAHVHFIVPIAEARTLLVGSTVDISMQVVTKE